jgi:hypothetical protein
MSPLLATEGDTKETKAVPRSERPDFAPIGQLLPKREERDSDDEDSDEEMQVNTIFIPQMGLKITFSYPRTGVKSTFFYSLYAR